MANAHRSGISTKPWRALVEPGRLHPADEGGAPDVKVAVDAEVAVELLTAGDSRPFREVPLQPVRVVRCRPHADPHRLEDRRGHADDAVQIRPALDRRQRVVDHRRAAGPGWSGRSAARSRRRSASSASTAARHAGAPVPSASRPWPVRPDAGTGHRRRVSAATAAISAESVLTTHRVTPGTRAAARRLCPIRGRPASGRMFLPGRPWSHRGQEHGQHARGVGHGSRA